MVFSSSIFLLYFLPFFLILYYILDKRYKNFFLFLSSILFYAWGAPDFILIVLVSVFADYYLVGAMHRQSKRSRKRFLLAASLMLNIGLLLYFKYANFFIENINGLLSSLGVTELGWTAIALPIGISFFTFQKVTYGVDVYRKLHGPLKSPVDYAMYILMFPQLIAGPIVRFNEIAGQIEDREARENMDNRISGFFRFIIGLAKKVLIANVLGEQVDIIFSMDTADINSSLAWIGVLAYAFQIYFDFSGYSDMAIGLGRMMGFRFPENFNNPYISRSISEFWRRWHITLGRFMKDYLYIPLGGNRVSPVRLYFNLWLVFLISGLWHGAAWNFVIWGAFHGLFLIMDRLFLLKFYTAIGKLPSIIITFFITLIGWVLFRAETTSFAFSYMAKMFAFDFGKMPLYFDHKFWFFMAMAILFSFFGAFKGVEAWQQKIFDEKQSRKKLILMSVFSIVFLYICIGSITSSGFNPFIYFRF